MEHLPEFDQFSVRVVTGEGDEETETVVWSKAENLPPMQVFTPISISLADWAGQDVRIRFHFNTVDATANNRCRCWHLDTA